MINYSNKNNSHCPNSDSLKNIKITPLGGVGEAGALNCMVYESEDSAFLIDCGLQFPDDETLGVDLIIPDFTYLETIRHKLKGLVLTHGHEDHIGAVPFLLREFDLPVYGTPFTLGLIRNKLSEHSDVKTNKFHSFEPSDRFVVGDFELEAMFVNHSIVGACALAVHTPYGAIVHLTDWKIDHTPVAGPTTDLKRFSKLGKEGVIALFSDSTNAEQPGATISEKEVIKRITKICSAHKGRILVTLFASNILRVQELGRLAKKLGRKLALVGRSMKNNTELARSLSILSFDGVELIDIEETRDMDPAKVMVLVTGSQGEERSALSRMAFNQFKLFKLGEGDLVLFSSKTIPGNETSVFTVIDHLYRRGTEVIYKAASEIHTSGHAKRDEMAEAIKRLHPRYFVPIHGEYRHLVKHIELAVETGVNKDRALLIENGQTLLLSDRGLELGGVVPTGRVFIDGHGMGDVDSVVLRDRRQLSTTGLVMCVVMIDRATGEIVRAPEIICRGVFEESEHPDLSNDASKEVMAALLETDKETRTDLHEMQEEVRLVTRRFFRRKLDKKPVVVPVVLEV